MTGKTEDLEIRLIFELEKVNWVEYMYRSGKLDEKLAISEANVLARSIAEILEMDSHLENVYLESYRTIVKLKCFYDFTRLVEDNRLSIKRHSHKNQVESTEDFEEIPNQLKEIVGILSLDESIKNDRSKDKNSLQHFVASYLVYRSNENKNVYHSDEKTKKELYEDIWSPPHDNEFFNIIRDVHEAYPMLYENDLKKKHGTDYKYDTMKKRMSKVLPTKRAPRSMNPAHNLNMFEQHVMQLHFLIYNTSYQRYLSNTTNGRVPEYETFQDIKNSMLMFQSRKPVSGIEDELFQRTVIEDTFHFAVFNGVTQLIESILKMVMEIIQVTSQYESVITLSWLEEINRNLPKLKNNYAFIFNEIKDEIAKYNHVESLEEKINQATEDEDSLEYATDMMKEILDKYESIYKNEKNIDYTQREITSHLFQMVVKLYYQSVGDETAFQK